MIEDPLEEDDFEGFAAITRRIPAIIVGDDLFVANLERIKHGVALGAANAMILKPTWWELFPKRSRLPAMPSATAT